MAASARLEKIKSGKIKKISKLLKTISNNYNEKKKNLIKQQRYEIKVLNQKKPTTVHKSLNQSVCEIEVYR